MRRLSNLFAFLVLAAAAVIVVPSSAAANGQRQVPLRQLFLDSDTIIVGKVGTPGKWTASGEPSNGVQSFERKVPIIVEETLKGEPAKMIEVMEYQQVSKSQTVTLGDGPDSVAKLKTRRVFTLNIYSDGTFYVPNGRNGDGLLLSKTNMATNIKRLRQMASIHKTETPDKTKIVELLVSMAEDPATRFDGAYELFVSLRYVLKQKQHDARPADPNRDPNLQPYILGEETFQDNYFYSGSDKQFADLLTASQKERLIRAFLSLDLSNKGKANAGDTYLMRAAGYMKDRRAIERFLETMPGRAKLESSEEGYVTAELIEIIAEHFGDEDLRQIAPRYYVLSHGAANTMVEREQYSRVTNVKESEIAAAQKKTYGQYRIELIERVLNHTRGLMGKK